MNRDYSLIENEEFKKISNDNRFYSLNVSDVDIYKVVHLIMTDILVFIHLDSQKML